MTTEKQIENALEKTTHKAEAVAAKIQAAVPERKIVTLELQKSQEKLEGESKQVLNYGTCRYCGQVRQVDDCTTQEQANEQATRRCDCPEATEYREVLRQQERRKRALEDADQNLTDLFGKQVLANETLELIRMATPLVYDQKLIAVTFKLNYTVSAKLSRNSKGNIVIERKDLEAQKVEI